MNCHMFWSWSFEVLESSWGEWSLIFLLLAGHGGVSFHLVENSLSHFKGWPYPLTSLVLLSLGYTTEQVISLLSLHIYSENSLIFLTWTLCTGLSLWFFCETIAWWPRYCHCSPSTKEDLRQFNDWGLTCTQWSLEACQPDDIPCRSHMTSHHALYVISLSVHWQERSINVDTLS